MGTWTLTISLRDPEGHLRDESTTQISDLREGRLGQSVNVADKAEATMGAAVDAAFAVAFPVHEEN